MRHASQPYTWRRSTERFVADRRGVLMAQPPTSRLSADQLVVIGASAGGVDALSVLVKSLPAELPAAVVIGQHLDPRRPSQLARILSRHAVLPVKSVTDTELLVPATIYVVPSNRDVSISDREVHVHVDVDPEHRPIPSIDRLLTT